MTATSTATPLRHGWGTLIMLDWSETPGRAPHCRAGTLRDATDRDMEGAELVRHRCSEMVRQ